MSKMDLDLELGTDNGQFYTKINKHSHPLHIVTIIDR